MIRRCLRGPPNMALARMPLDVTVILSGEMERGRHWLSGAKATLFALGMKMENKGFDPTLN